ncbi:cyclopropane mycolic acid synthase family methyltransferase [Mycolicibacterium thermoresistibile]
MVNAPAPRTAEIRQQFDDVQSHYDVSNEFFALFLDPSMTYSAAYFHRDDMTLEEAQLAKLDLSLDKLRLRPGMTLLDIGCGWGATMKRAIEKYDVNVVGLTLSENQVEHCTALLDGVDTDRSHRVLLSDWADFDEPVDRIITIEALEHFGFHRYDEFFDYAYNALPDDGVMLLHAITALTGKQIIEQGLPMTFELARFIKFIITEIFPGGRLPTIQKVEEHTAKAGFTITRNQSLRSSFLRTVEMWAETLEARRDEAIATQSEEAYDRYMHFLTGTAKGFRVGYIDVNQFTLEKTVT